jgi:hypothetical protein
VKGGVDGVNSLNNSSSMIAKHDIAIEVAVFNRDIIDEYPSTWYEHVGPF